MARPWVVRFAALIIAPVAAMSGGSADISWTAVSHTMETVWLVSISADSWRDIKIQVGSELQATAARVDRVFADNEEVWHLAYIWSPQATSEWHRVCYMCEHDVLGQQLGSCFADVIEKTQTSTGAFSCSRNARELKAAVDRYATSSSRTVGKMLTFPGYSNWVFPDGKIPDGWTEGTITDEKMSELLSEYGISPEDLIMLTEGTVPEDWVSRMLLESGLLPEGWAFTDDARQKARMYLDGAIADRWMFRHGRLFSEQGLPQGGISEGNWYTGNWYVPEGVRPDGGLDAPEWAYSPDPLPTIVDEYIHRGIQGGWISASHLAAIENEATALGGISAQGWMFSEGRLFPEGSTFPKGGIVPEHGDWRLKREKLFQLDEDAANTRVSFGWLAEPIEYEFDIGGVAFGEDNAGALAMYIPGFSIELLWDPAQLGGSGLFAKIYDAYGDLHEKDGKEFSFELPPTVVSSFRNALVTDRELTINLRVDPGIGEIVVKDPWSDGSLWRLDLGESIPEGSIGVGTKSLRANFGNFASLP